jgi:ketosteroid isomerase-like protein
MKKDEEGHNDIVFEVGTYVLRGKDGGILDKGKYLAIWKQEGGRWKSHREIWNGCLPFKANLSKLKMG